MTGEQLARIQETLGLDNQALCDTLNMALGKRYNTERLSQWKRDVRPVPKWVEGFLLEVAAEQNGVRLAEMTESLETGLGGPLLDGDQAPPQPAETEPQPKGQQPLSAGGAYAKICTDLWGTVALTVSSVGALANRGTLIEDGRIIDRDKEALGKAWGKLAETNETFRKMLDQTLTGGAWIEIAIVTGVTGNKLLDNHRRAAALERAQAAQDAVVEEIRRDRPAAA